MKNNLFANGLLMLIGLLLLLAAFQMFGWGRGTQTLEAESFDLTTLNKLEVSGTGEGDVSVDDKALEKITDTPLFSYDRQPFIPLEVVEGPGEDEEEEFEPEPLKAKVTSIIIIEENSYAMVFDELSKESITLKQGMPLPGEQGLWTVDTINPRTVTFVAEGEEPVELGLDVFDGQLNAGARNNNRGNKQNKNNRSDNNNNNRASNNQQAQKNSAEEIRKKIAERRAQMRANAAKGNKE